MTTTMIFFDPAFAVGTTLTAVVFTAGSGAIQHFALKNVDLRTALQVGLSGIIGVVAGSAVFGYIKTYGELIDLIIGLAFIVVSIRMLYEGIFATAPPREGSQVPGTGLWRWPKPSSFLRSLALRAEEPRAKQRFS